MRRAGLVGLLATAALAAVALVAATLLAGSRTAVAHAALLRSSPESQAQLTASPRTIDLWFTEPLESAFSTFELVNAAGQSFAVSQLTVDPGDQFHLSGVPEVLPAGLYTISYRSLSTRDGHQWTGTFAFTVLNPDGSAPTGDPASPTAGTKTSPERIVGRWLGFVGWAMALGAILLVGLSTRATALLPAVEAPIRRTAHALLVGALPLLAASGALELGAQASALQADPGAVLGQTRFGTLWLWRQLAGLTLGMLTLLSVLAVRRGRRRASGLLDVAIALAVIVGLCTISLLSHAAAAPGAGWAVLFDAVHLIVAALWLGGLMALAGLVLRLRRGLRERQGHLLRVALMAQVLRPFSLVATTAVVALTVTGLVRGFGEVPSLSALVDTAYGRWLIVKLLLVMPLLFVARLNHAALRRAASGGRQTELAVARRLARTLPLEAELGILVLAAVAILGQVPTARGTASLPPAAAQSYTSIQTAADLSVHLQVTPAKVGTNEIRAHIYPSAGGTTDDLGRVFFTFAAMGRDGGERIEGTRAGGGLYTLSGDFFSLEQTWQVRLDLQRSDEDAVAMFTVPIDASVLSAGRGLWDSPAPQLQTFVLLGGIALVGGVLVIVAAQSLRRRIRGRFILLGGVLVFGGLWAVLSAEPLNDLPTENPVAASQESLTLGSSLFAANCASCHGTSGRGDGPAGTALPTKPADLRVHVPLHADADTFGFIALGLPKTGMPAWRERLSDEEIWHVVNYLRQGLGR